MAPPEVKCASYSGFLSTVQWDSGLPVDELPVVNGAMDTATLPLLPLWPRLASHWDSCPPCNGTAASSPGASAPAADAGGKPDSLALASAASEVFPLASVLPVVCACIPTQSRKSKRTRDHMEPHCHAEHQQSMQWRQRETGDKQNAKKDTKYPQITPGRMLVSTQIMSIQT